MKVFFATAAAALVGLAIINPAEARCFWNGFDMECHYPVTRERVYREIYTEVAPVYQPPPVIYREVEPPTVLYYDEWR